MALHGVLPVTGSWPAVWAQWLFFLFLTAGMLALGNATARHRNPNLFSGVVLGGSMIKLFGSLLYLFAYQKVAQPQDRNHLVLFFLFYVGFTILEILLLQRMVREEAERRRAGSD